MRKVDSTVVSVESKFQRGEGGGMTLMKMLKSVGARQKPRGGLRIVFSLRKRVTADV